MAWLKIPVKPLATLKTVVHEKLGERLQRMFGSTVYPQVSEYHDPMPYASENLSHLIPSANFPHPWNRDASLSQDFVMVTEFSELEGPKPLFVQPSEGFGNFDINAFAVKIMSVDHQPPKNGFTLIEDKQVLLSETAERVSAYVYYFILYDSQARGYVRPFCMAYVTPDCRKLITFYKEIHKAFSKVSHDIKVGNLRLFANEMRHQLRDLEYTYDCLTKLSTQDDIYTSPPPSPMPEEVSAPTNSPCITAQSVKLLKEETEAILEVLQQNKAIFENDFEESQTVMDYKCDNDSLDSSSCGCLKDTELDSLHQRAPVCSKDHSKLTSSSDNHRNVVGHTKHLLYRPRGDSSGSESDPEKRLSAHHESKAHVQLHNQERAARSHKPSEIIHNHVTRLKSDSSVKPSVVRNDYYVRVSSVDRSHSCSDIWSSVDGQKDTYEYATQGHFPGIFHSSESDFSTSSTSSQLDHIALEHSDPVTSLLENRTNRLEQVLLVGDEISYKPKLYKPPSRKRFEFMLRNLKTLCLNESGTDQWQQLGLIQQHFSQDLAILKMHRMEKQLTDPSCALVTFGGCITDNFLHGLFRCDLETEYGTTKNHWSSLEALSAKNDTVNQLVRTSTQLMHSDDTAPSSSSSLSSHCPNSNQSQPSENSVPLSLNPNLVSNKKLSHRPDDVWTILAPRENESESAASSKYSNENAPSCLACSERCEDTSSCIDCRELKIADRGTIHHILCDTNSSKGSGLSFDDGSDESFHSVSSVQSSLCPKPCLWKKPCTIFADVLHCKEHEQQAKSLMHILQNYQNLNKLVASILSGRPVVIIGKNHSEEEVKVIVNALSLFLPGNLRDQKKRIVPWLKRSLHLKDLSKMQLVGLNRSTKRRNCALPLSLMTYVSILDIEQRLVVAPNYQGLIVTSMLKQLQQFQSPKATLAFIHSCFQEISSKAFLYYHSFCMTSVNPSANNGCVTLEKLTKEFKDTSEQFLKTCNITNGDRRIVEHTASLVLKQVLKEAQAKSADGTIDVGGSPIHLSYRPSYKWEC